jgi:ATP-binding cassette subfamily F protein uup
VAPPLIQLKDIALTFGGTPLLGGADLSISAGERIGLVGRNGSGKSTLLKIAAGHVEPDHGTRFLEPGATVRYLPQEPDFAGYTSTRAYVEAGLGPGDDVHACRYLLEQLGLTGDEDPAHLSGGEARRVALARVLAPSPDILLLDEPTNHLDLTTIEWLERELDNRSRALVIVSHDRRFLTNLSRSTVWLDRGKTRRIECGFREFEAWRDEVLAEEEREQHKLDRRIAAEEHWLRYGVSGRRKRNVRRLGMLQALRESRRTYRRATGNAELAATEADKSGALVIEARNVGKRWGVNVVVSDLSIRIQRGDRLGIVGPNGSGKTTLINILTGARSPDVGSVRLGPNVEMATLDQHRESLDPATSLSDALTGSHGDMVMIGNQPRHVTSYMRDFLFTPEQIGTPLSVLSGGERGRVMLARTLAKSSNLLVLDEPTNDLDLETLDVLEEMLNEYSGTVLLISHDRDFLDRIVGSVIVPEGEGRWQEYAGGYSDMLIQRGTDVKRQSAKPVANKSAKRVEFEFADPPPRKRRLSFNEKHALQQLPKTIEILQEEIKEQLKLLDSPQLYARDRKRFDEASTAIVEAQTKLAEAEERWLALEILREEIEQG